jgi:hypothetical protein
LRTLSLAAAPPQRHLRAMRSIRSLVVAMMFVVLFCRNSAEKLNQGENMLNRTNATHLLVTLLISAGIGGPVAAAKPPAASSSLIADFVAHTEAFVPVGPMLLSRCSGASTSKYYVEWPRHDVCVFTATFDAMGTLVSSDAGVKPAGMEADPGRVKELCNADELCDDPILTAANRKGVISSVQFFIQDDIGTEGIQYETEKVVLDAPVQAQPCGFLVHVHRDFVPVWRLAGHTGGPRVEMVGTISIGDVWYRPAVPCSR